MDKFPHYLQQDAADCGPTCLRMIAKYYGMTYSAATIKNYCHISKYGVSLLSISDAARHLGFHTLGVRISFDQLVHDASHPCIIHWNQNHFVVVYKIQKKKGNDYNIYVADPSSQKLCYKKDEFLRCWLSSLNGEERKGYALLLEPSSAATNQFDEENEKKNYRLSYFFKYLIPFRNLILQLLLGLLLVNIIQLLFPFLTQLMVDKGIGEQNYSFITLLLVAQLSLYITQLIVGYLRGWLLLYINSRVSISLISDFLFKLMNMPLNFFDAKRIGDIIQRIGDHDRIKRFLMGESINILFSSSSFFIYSLILGYFSLRILCVFLFGNTLYILWILFFLKYRRELEIKRFNQSSTEQSNLIQLVQGIQDIKLNNCEKQKRWEWERIQVDLYKISIKGLSIEQIQQTGSLFFSQSTNILISYIAATAVVEKQMTLGMMMSLTYIIGQISVPIGDFINFIRSWQDASFSLERLNDVLCQEGEEANIENKLSILPHKGTIKIDNITFSYDGSNHNLALDGISLIIPHNKVTAIVGESGSGKSTLIKLIQGFYRPNSGVILIGGVDLDTINPHIWRSKTGSVMQDSFIFSDTIAKNIALGDDNVNNEQLINAATLANADEFISKMPLGYNTKIGIDGSGLSQGQRQRLLLARAIYKNPDYIFLDEATNSLDALGEFTSPE